MNWRDPYELTESQARVLAFVVAHGDAKQRPPTRAEIAHHMGWRSPNAAEEVLQALQKKGRLRLSSGKARGIVVDERLRDAAGKTAPAKPEKAAS